MKKKEENSIKTELIHLFVSLPTSEVCSLRDVSTKLPVHQIKSKIELRVGIPGDLIHLYFMNNELEDDKTVEKYKLKHGCILRVRMHKTWLGLFLACTKGDVFEVFENGVQTINEESSNHFDVDLWNKLVVKRATFALFMATYHGYLSLMLELLNSSAADITGCTVFGRTALHIAAFQGFVGCVSLLLSEGAESNALDVFGKTPLQLAHINGHTYCQKRLYMHQTSERQSGESHDKTSDTRLQTAPHQMMKNFHQNQRIKKNMSSNSTCRAARKEKINKSLPNITNHTKRSSISPQNLTNSSHSYDLPEMTIIESPKEHHSGDANLSQSSTPVLRAPTAPVRLEDSTRSSTLHGICGIDAVLRTAQDDVVGEYHNIDESIADVNVSTLKISLPKEDIPTNFETEQHEMISITSNNDIHDKTRGRYHPGRKMLSFVLKAEEQRNLNQDTSSNSSTDSEEHCDKFLTLTADGVHAAEQNKEDEKSWTLTFYGYSDSNQGPDDRLWTTYESVVETTTSPHRKLGASLSYEAWLEKKRQSAKEIRTERPSSACNSKSKVGRELDVDAFNQWLESKKKFRKHSKSETITIEHHRAGSGMAFQEWLRQKRRQLNESSMGSQSQVPEKVDPRPKQACLGGKTFSEWLDEKKTLNQTFVRVDTNNKKIRSQSGKTFQEWLKDKNKEKQDQAIVQENLAILELQKKVFAEEQRRLKPRVKTFDQWFEEKKTQNIIELIQSKNSPHDTGLLNSKTKFPEDACLVYDMWLTSKHMEEFKREEILYEEMVEKWKKKEQERLQIRRSILSKLNQAKKDK